MDKKIIRVWLQLEDRALQPISRQVVTTVRTLGSDYVTQGVVCTEGLTDDSELRNCGLDQVILMEGPIFRGFVPEVLTDQLCELEPAEILLFPATPEGRTLSAMVGARLHTGVTADCTTLELREDGCLLQTRPAFSGSRMAAIVTETRPQIASLRFGMEAGEPERDTEVIRVAVSGEADPDCVWLDRAVEGQRTEKRILAVGGGLRDREDLKLFEALAEKLHCSLCCSRALVDRGWMPRSAQIGLSGACVSADLLLAFGISGSVQFQAGLGRIGKLIAVDVNGQTSLMGLADLPICGDLYEVAGELLK